MDRLKKLMRSFLWDSNQDKRGLHLIGSDKVTKSKERGLGLHHKGEISKGLICKNLFLLIKRKDESWIK